MDTQVFSIVPASSKPVWFFLAIAIVPLLVSMMLFYLAISCQQTRVEVSRSELRISGLYGRRISAAHLLPEQAQLVDLRQSPRLQPKWRTNGAALPGFRTGWFRLGNGERSLLFVTHTDRVVYLPTRDGYSVLLSPEDPERFLQAVRNLNTASQ